MICSQSPISGLVDRYFGYTIAKKKTKAVIKIGNNTMPPLHPALVHFPIALLLFSIAADLIGFVKRDASLYAAGRWALIASFFTAAATIVAGVSDMQRAALQEVTHQYVDLHLSVGIILLAAIAALSAWRWITAKRSDVVIGWKYIGSAVLVVALMIFQGWLGGELVFSYGAGVAAAGQGTESATKARSRLEKLPDRLLSDQDVHSQPSDHSDEHDTHPGQ